MTRLSRYRAGEPMIFRLHDTATGADTPFTPHDPANIRMYVCGPTVYDDIHIGNARPLVVFDILYRLLRDVYGPGHVTYVRNITDVDDKINRRAAENGEPIDALTARTNARFQEDAARLLCLPPDVQPRATAHIPGMIALITRLIDLGHAYVAEGHVLFHTPSWPDYGRFAGRDADAMRAGARVEVAPYKKHAADFILGKPSLPGEPSWDSPWGAGRPGWHIECSAMSAALLGTDFDIHGGGQDLIFPHHQNELAQSLCGHPGSGFARYWLHNGHVTVNGEKMSKSLGNFHTVRDLLRDFPGEALRLVLLKTRYRQPLDFTLEKCREAKQELDRFYAALRDTPPDPAAVAETEAAPEMADGAVSRALLEDLNTPLALAGLHELLSRLTTARDTAARRAAAAGLRAAAARLGLLGQEPADWFRQGAEDMQDDIQRMIARRARARDARDFAEADRIRDVLLEQGIALEDKPGGRTEWRRV